MKIMKSKAMRRALTLALALLAAEQVSLSQAAEIKGFANVCAETKQICVWHQAVIAPPKNWVEDEAWTRRYQATVLFENGDHSDTKPVMYLRTHAGEAKISLEDYIKGAQDGWRKDFEGNTIEALPDVQRPGRPVIKVYLYTNPALADQAYELTAFMKDVDQAHPKQTYFFQVVLSSPSKEELERTKAAFYDLLARM